MLSLLNRAFEPSVPYPDKVTYMTSVNYLQSVRADNGSAIAEKIKDLLSEKDTRLQGLQFLELALQQNPDIYLKGRWTPTLCDYIKEPVSHILKDHICKVLCLIIPCMAKDPAANNAEIQKCSTFLVPYLLSEVEKQVEWTESAALCLSACLKGFPVYLLSHKNRLIKVLCHQLSYSVSSRSFEVFAECFSLLPTCTPPSRDEDVIGNNWKEQYLMTLNSMHFILNHFVTSLIDEDEGGDIVYRNEVLAAAGDLPFEEDDHDDEENVYPSFTRNVRRFINLCKCLAKMLSLPVSPKSVPVPVKLTLTCISRLFAIQEMCKNVPSSLEQQIILSNLAQMQIASFVLLESMSLNCNIVSYSSLISEMMIFALRASTLPNITSESISPLRHAVWKFLDIWVGTHGAKVAPDILIDHSTIIEEVLKDIILEDSSQISTPVVPTKSKKNASLTSARFVHKSQHSVCKAALKFLETILYSGASFINKKTLQVVFHQVVQVACAISPGGEFPFPYDDDMCRKRLYHTLLAIAVTTKADQWEPLQYANGIFKKAVQDPSPKVVRQGHKLMAICRMYLHARKPIPVVRDLEEKQRRASNAAAKLSEWSSEDYVQNMTPVEITSVTSENQTPRITQTFHNPNEGEMPSEEYMQVDAHYSEQISENQCNGEDLLEIQTSQCQDDVDSDEEEEEDDDEPSYGDEEMNQEVEMQEEPVYIPTKIQVLNPVHIASENEQNVEEREYEELRPCAKNEESNKNMHLNGVRNSNIVPDEEVQSETVQNVANENGLFLEDEDLDEEEGEEDEEEESTGYPAEKRAADYYETPAKMQKHDKEVSEEPQEEREGSRSPTLQEMKADFCCEIDDVKS